MEPRAEMEGLCGAQGSRARILCPSSLLSAKQSLGAWVPSLWAQEVQAGGGEGLGVPDRKIPESLQA